MGFGGLSYSWNVIATDVTNLRNRGLAFAFTSSPAVITAFAGSKAAEGFYNNVSWQWGIGCWAIIFPCLALPLYYVLNRALRKAEREGIIIQEKSGRTLPQQVWYVVKEFDCKCPQMPASQHAHNADIFWNQQYPVLVYLPVASSYFFCHSHWLLPHPTDGRPAILLP